MKAHSHGTCFLAMALERQMKTTSAYATMKTATGSRIMAMISTRFSVGWCPFLTSFPAKPSSAAAMDPIVTCGRVARVRVYFLGFRGARCTAVRWLPMQVRSGL